MVFPVRGAVFPERCVRCNAPGAKQYLKRLGWTPSWVLFTLVFGCLPVVILSLIFTRRGAVTISVCERHAARRRLGLTLVLLWPLSVGGFLFGMSEAFPNGTVAAQLLVLVAGVAMLAMLIAAVVLRRDMTPLHIDKTVACVRVGDAFLASFPR